MHSSTRGIVHGGGVCVRVEGGGGVCVWIKQAGNRVVTNHTGLQGEHQDTAWANASCESTRVLSIRRCMGRGYPPLLVQHTHTLARPAVRSSRPPASASVGRLWGRQRVVTPWPEQRHPHCGTGVTSQPPGHKGVHTTHHWHSQGRPGLPSTVVLHTPPPPPPPPPLPTPVTCRARHGGEGGLGEGELGACLFSGWVVPIPPPPTSQTQQHNTYHDHSKGSVRGVGQGQQGESERCRDGWDAVDWA